MVLVKCFVAAVKSLQVLQYCVVFIFIYLGHWAHSDILENRVSLKSVLNWGCIWDVCSSENYSAVIRRISMNPWLQIDKFSRWQTSRYFFLIFAENSIWHFMQSGSLKTICMKCEIIFPVRNKKKIFRNVVWWNFYLALKQSVRTGYSRSSF